MRFINNVCRRRVILFFYVQIKTAAEPPDPLISTNLCAEFTSQRSLSSRTKVHLNWFKKKNNLRSPIRLFLRLLHAEGRLL